MGWGTGQFFIVEFQSINKEVVVALVVQSCPTVCNPINVACQAPVSMEFSRQEYWSGLPFPSAVDLSDPGIKPGSPALAGGYFTTSATWETQVGMCGVCVCVCVCVLVAQSCLTLCNPMDCSPLGSSVWNSPGKNTGVGCHFLLQQIFLT